MNVVDVVKESVRTVWRNKALWLFGLFVASGSSGGSGTSHSSSKGAGGGPLGAEALNQAGHEALEKLTPYLEWLAVAAVLGVVLAAAALVLHVVSEGALIDGARRAREGQKVRLKESFRAGWSSFGRVLGIKLCLALCLVPVGLVAMGLVLLAMLHVVPLWTVVALGAPLVAVAVVVAVTVYLTCMFALRIAVLEDKPVRVALREARRYLSGRLLESLKLWLAVFASQLGGSVVMLAALVPAALLGAGVYFSAGLVPALVAGGALALPLAGAAAGAVGALKSTVWTVGYLTSRAQENA